jgi:antitoxin component YwqK of YwqJK toxin-antitoxin module
MVCLAQGRVKPVGAATGHGHGLKSAASTLDTQSVEILPSALSFRVITTLELESEDAVPPGFSGRVRFVADGVLLAVAWYTDGALHNPARRVPAYVRYRPSGRVKQERHYCEGLLHDPAGLQPAVRGYYANGTVRYEEHYRYGRRHDGPDGAPAILKWRLDGSVRSSLHYRDGRRVAEGLRRPAR